MRLAVSRHERVDVLTCPGAGSFARARRPGAQRPDQACPALWNGTVALGQADDSSSHCGGTTKPNAVGQLMYPERSWRRRRVMFTTSRAGVGLHCVAVHFSVEVTCERSPASAASSGPLARSGESVRRAERVQAISSQRHERCRRTWRLRCRQSGQAPATHRES